MGRRGGQKIAGDGSPAEGVRAAEEANPLRKWPRRPTVRALRRRGQFFQPPPGKPPKGGCVLSVPETDAGVRGEKPKVLETTREKELGKLTP